MTTEVETVDVEFLGKLPGSPWKRVGDVLVELCEERGQDYFGPDPLIGYSLSVNGTLVMFFLEKDHALAQKVYERLIYALS